MLRAGAGARRRGGRADPRPLAQDVVESHRRRILPQQLRRRRLAVETLLQIVERRDGAVAQYQQLAVERHIRRHRRADIGKGGADLVARARIEPLLAAAGDELHADAVPFPLGQVFVRVEPGEVAILDRLRQHQRAKIRQIASLRRRTAALEPVEQRLVGRGHPVPDLFDPIDSTSLHSASAVLARRADTPIRRLPVTSFNSAQRPVAVQRIEPGPEHCATSLRLVALQPLDDLGQARDVPAPPRVSGQISATVSARSPTKS